MVRKEVIVPSTNGETEARGVEEGKDLPRVQEGTSGMDRNVCDDLSRAMRSKPVPVWDGVHPTSGTPRLVGIWEHLGSAHSKILQEGARTERAKDWDPFVSRQNKKKRETFIRQGGKGGTGEKKRLRLRSIPPASPLSLTAQDIWGGGGTKPSHNSAVHLSAACEWTRGLILLALRVKSSQGRRLSPGPKEKNPFHCKSLGRDKGLLCRVFRLSCQRTFSALGQQWGHFKRPFNYLFPPIAAACRGSYGKKKKGKKRLISTVLIW